MPEARGTFLAAQQIGQQKIPPSTSFPYPPSKSKSRGLTRPTLNTTGRIPRHRSNANKTDEITRSVCANATRSSAFALVAEIKPFLAKSTAQIAWENAGRRRVFAVADRQQYQNRPAALTSADAILSDDRLKRRLYSIDGTSSLASSSKASVIISTIRGLTKCQRWPKRSRSPSATTGALARCASMARL